MGDIAATTIDEPVGLPVVPPVVALPVGVSLPVVPPAVTVVEAVGVILGDGDAVGENGATQDPVGVTVGDTVSVTEGEVVEDRE